MKYKIIILFLSVLLHGEDYHKTHPKAWEATTLNDAAIALYGKQEFSTIKQTLNMELIVPQVTIDTPEYIPVRVRSDIPAKSIAIFVDRQERPLVAVFHQDNFEKIDLSLTIRMERKGTLFAVIEGLNGILYYKRAFIDILCLPCMAKGAE
jgi:predicted secreted protein